MVKSVVDRSGLNAPQWTQFVSEPARIGQEGSFDENGEDPLPAFQKLRYLVPDHVVRVAQPGLAGAAVRREPVSPDDDHAGFAVLKRLADGFLPHAAAGGNALDVQEDTSLPKVLREVPRHSARGRRNCWVESA